MKPIQSINMGFEVTPIFCDADISPSAKQEIITAVREVVKSQEFINMVNDRVFNIKLDREFEVINR